MRVDHVRLQAVLFQYLVKRHPVHSRRLHRHRLDAAGFQPYSHAVQVRSETAELLHGLWVASRWDGYIMFRIPNIDSGRIFIQRW